MSKKIYTQHTETPDGWIPLELFNKPSTIALWVRNYHTWCSHFSFKTLMGDHFSNNCSKAFTVKQAEQMQEFKQRNK